MPVRVRAHRRRNPNWSIIRYRDDPDWQRRLSKVQKSLRETPGNKRLRKKLLSLGGDEVVLVQKDEDLEKLLARGRTWTSEDVEFHEMEPNECHRNAALLGQATRMKIVTGYALAPDGLWRMHSWALNPYNKNVIETCPVDFVKYFGVVLNKKEARRFIHENIF